jgi:molybdopterin-synthase adenylyltransferase
MLNRYHRQMLLPDVGEEGQARLSRAHALLVGCGALGCTIADLLVRAGIGTITIVDRDVVELTNLQRQSLFDERDVAEGLPKAAAAARRLAAVNSEMRVRAIVADFTAENAEQIAAGEHVGLEEREEPAGAARVIIDGTDNFETRYLMNDVAVKRNIPFVYGGAVGTRGMQMTIPAGGRPCLRCLFEEIPAPGTAPTCDTAGVLAPVATIVAGCQAAEAMRVLLDVPTARLPPNLLDFDLWQGQRRRLDVSRMARGDCPCCAQQRFEFLSGQRGGGGGGTTTLCGRSSVQIMPPLPTPPATRTRLDLKALARRLGSHGRFEANRFLVRGEFLGEQEHGQPLSMTVFADGRALVHGTTDPTRARVIYARYIGS